MKKTGGLIWQFLNTKKQKQAADRGWTSEDITDIITNPVLTRSTTYYGTGERATCYYRNDGHYVIRGDITGTIFHFSDTGDQEWIDSLTNQPITPIKE